MSLSLNLLFIYLSNGAPPPSGWSKLNTNDSSLDNPGLAGGEEMIRDSSGPWVGGFSWVIGITSSGQEAKLRAFKIV